MPINVSQVTQRVKTIKRNFQDGQTLNLVYKPHAYTVSQQLAFEGTFYSLANDASSSGEDSSERLAERYTMLVDWIIDHVQSWDIQEDNGRNVALTSEALHGLPFDLLQFVFDAITSDKSGGKGSRTR